MDRKKKEDWRPPCFGEFKGEKWVAESGLCDNCSYGNECLDFSIKKSEGDGEKEKNLTERIVRLLDDYALLPKPFTTNDAINLRNFRHALTDLLMEEAGT